MLMFVLTLSVSCTQKDQDDRESKIPQDAPATTRSSMVWEYPVQPGTPQWYQLNTERECVAVLQVPENVLTSLSSKEIVDLCMEFPRFWYYIYFDTPQNDGFSVMLDRFNILRHLLTQNDAGKYLIVAYKDANMTGFKTLQYSNKFWTLKLKYLELLLVQKEVLQSLAPNEKFELIVEANVKLSQKIYDEAFASNSGIEPTLRIMASILEMEKYPGLDAVSNRELITYLIQTGRLGDVSLINEIIRVTEEYIANKSQTK